MEERTAPPGDASVRGRLIADNGDNHPRSRDHRAEMRWVQGRAFLHATLDALTVHIAVLDEDGVILAVNAAWRRFAAANGAAGGACGPGRDYLAACDAGAGAGAPGAAAVAAAIRATLAGYDAPPFEYEYPCHGPHEERWFVVRVTPFAGVAPARAVVAHEDITARRRAEGRSRVQAQLLDQVEAAVIATDRAGLVTHWNAHATALYGWTAAEALGRPIGALTVGPRDPVHTAAVWTRLRGGESWAGEFTARRKDGGTFPAHVTNAPIRDTDGRVVGVVGVSLDISARQEAEAALRHSEGLLAEAQRIANLGSWEYDYATGQVTWSDECFRIGGYAPQSFVPTPARLLAAAHPDDRERVRRAQDAALEPGAPYELEYRLVRPDGAVRVIHQQAEDVRDSAGRTLRRVGIVRDITERTALEERLAHQAHHDALTGLPNRALLFERLDRALAPGRGDGVPCAVLFLDLDRFKDVNDLRGHDVGDRLLIAVAGRLRAALRAEDTLARLGGDEFIVLVDRVADTDAVAAVAEHLAAAVASPFLVDGHAHAVALSVGVALSGPGHARPEDLLRDADLAMYRAKDAGGAGYVFFDPAMQAALAARVALEADLRRALERGEFALHYQPVVSLADGRIVKAEALVRWRHPARGPVSPGEFIPLAEETGLIVPLGRWVLGEACRQARAWQAVGTPVAVAVNLTAREFQRPELVADIADVLAATGLDACWLRLEITESLAMRNAAAAVATLAALRALGVRVAIDDFGTGYSSLAYLKHLPADMLKIDKAFVDDLGTDEAATAIVAAIIALGHTLGLMVIGEGVETAAQAERLRALGCDWAQGYHFARPLPPGELGALLARAAPRGPTAATAAARPVSTGELRQQRAARARRRLLPDAAPPIANR